MIQVQALARELFAPLFAMSDAELASHGAVRRVADAQPGFPCRVSLVDAEPGETVILAHFEHQPAHSPFRASHAIYVRQDAEQALPSPGEIPQLLRLRTISLRGFDAAGMMIDADLVEGSALEKAAERMLADPSVRYLHAHFAKPGCFACRIDRA